MNLNSIQLVADMLGATHVKAPNSHGWVHITCPLAAWDHEKGTDSSPSFGITVNEHGESGMHCFSCGFSGSLMELVQRLRYFKAEVDVKGLLEVATAELDGSDLPTFDTPLWQSKEGLYPFPEAWLQSFSHSTDSGLAMYYLKSRKGGPIPLSIAQRLDLRWDGMRKRVCFPIRGSDGTLYGLHGRSIDPNEELRYLAYTYKDATNPEVWLGEDTVDWSQPVIFTESVFDMARVLQVYDNVISNLKAGISDEALLRIKSAFEIVTLYDPDKAGDKARTRLGAWVKYDKSAKRMIRHVHLDGKDAGDHTPEELRDILAPYVPVKKQLVLE